MLKRLVANRNKRKPTLYDQTNQQSDNYGGKGEKKERGGGSSFIIGIVYRVFFLIYIFGYNYCKNIKQILMCMCTRACARVDETSEN